MQCSDLCSECTEKNLERRDAEGTFAFGTRERPNTVPLLWQQGNSFHVSTEGSVGSLIVDGGDVEMQGED